MSSPQRRPNVAEAPGLRLLYTTYLYWSPELRCAITLTTPSRITPSRRCAAGTFSIALDQAVANTCTSQRTPLQNLYRNRPARCRSRPQAMLDAQPISPHKPDNRANLSTRPNGPPGHLQRLHNGPQPLHQEDRLSRWNLASSMHRGRLGLTCGMALFPIAV